MRLDLSRESGVRLPEDFVEGGLNRLLRCAAARAGGGLQTLRVVFGFVTHETLLEVAAANAGALRELHAHGDDHMTGFSAAQAEALCVAAPLLDVLATDVNNTFRNDADVQTVRRALRKRRPSGRCACDT